MVLTKAAPIEGSRIHALRRRNRLATGLDSAVTLEIGVKQAKTWLLTPWPHPIGSVMPLWCVLLRDSRDVCFAITQASGLFNRA